MEQVLFKKLSRTENEDIPVIRLHYALPSLFLCMFRLFGSLVFDDRNCSHVSLQASETIEPHPYLE